MARYASKHFIAKGQSMAGRGLDPSSDSGLPDRLRMYVLEGWARGRKGKPAGRWEEVEKGSHRIFCPNDRPKLKAMECGQ